MKTAAALAILLLVGCATIPAAPPPQKVLIEVSSATDQKVAVEDDHNHIAQSMEVVNPEGKLSSISFISGDKAYTKVSAGLSIFDVTSLWNDFVYFENKTGIREVDLFINSPGGDAFSGLALADEIERAKRRGFKITAHASGIIASAAVPVFAVCSVRMAAPGTIFLVHEASLWKWPGRETASDIRSQGDLMNLLEDRYVEKLVANSKLDMAKWKELEKNTTWFSDEKAMEWGLVDSME